MEPDEIIDQIRQISPGCISGFRLSPAELPEPIKSYFSTVYRLSCFCGSDKGAILGYPLKDYNPTYGGSDFITPLSFRCAECSTHTGIIDTQIHGYHAEVGKIEGGVGSSKIRGVGEPVPFICPGCCATVFSAVVGFVYWDFDIALDDSELPAQEFFNEFHIYGVCEGCGKASAVTQLGKL